MKLSTIMSLFFLPVLFGLLLAAPVAAAPAPACATPPSGMISWWGSPTGPSDLVDGNPAILMGQAMYTTQPGATTGVFVNLNGGANFFQVFTPSGGATSAGSSSVQFAAPSGPSNLWLAGKAHTVEGWIGVQALQPSALVPLTPIQAGGFGGTWYNYLNPGQGTLCSIVWPSTSPSQIAYLCAPYAGIVEQGIYHVAQTYTGSTCDFSPCPPAMLTVYVNGVPVISGTPMTGDISMLASSWPTSFQAGDVFGTALIGKGWFPNDNAVGNFNLVMADTAIYNRVLSSTEVQGIVAAQLNMKCKAPPAPVCGNGVVDTGETCDIGATNVGNNHCVVGQLYKRCTSCQLEDVLYAMESIANNNCADKVDNDCNGLIDTDETACVDPNACLVPPAGLISWWPGNGNGNDVIDSNRVISFGEASYMSYGKVHEAFTNLNGNTNYFATTSIPPAAAAGNSKLQLSSLPPAPVDNLNLVGKSFTLENWVKIDSITPLSSGMAWVPVSAVRAGSFGGIFYLSDPVRGTYLGGVLWNTPTTVVALSAPATLPMGEWVHVAMSWDVNTQMVSIYLNGNVLLSRTPNPANEIMPVSMLAPVFPGSFQPDDVYGTTLLGKAWFPNDNFGNYQISLDEVSVYGVVLSGAQINSIYNVDSRGKCLGVVCGDNIKEGTETCDGTALGGATCESLGLGTGTLACAVGCAGFDTSGCVTPPTARCGDGEKNGDEQCDVGDTNFGNNRCIADQVGQRCTETCVLETVTGTESGISACLDGIDNDCNSFIDSQDILHCDTIAPVLKNNPYTTPTNVQSVVLGGTFTDGPTGIATGIKSIEVLVNGLSQGFATLGGGADLAPSGGGGAGAISGTWSISLLLAEGKNAIAEQALDRAGNMAQSSKSILLDTQAPYAEFAIVDSDNDGFIEAGTITGFDAPKAPATDASGVKGLWISLNNGPWVFIQGPTFGASVTELPFDTLSVAFYAEDNAGNKGLIVSKTYTIDKCVAGSGSFQGCPYGDKSMVTLHTVNLGGGASTKAPLSGVEVRIFDRNNADFQAVAGSKNPSGELYGVVFEADAGRIGRCTTGADGGCTTGISTGGNLLVIAKFYDILTKKTVYIGRPDELSDFTNKLASKEFQIMKVFQKGKFLEYRGGSKLVVTGSYLEVIAPESSVWEGTKAVYPFIFISDSDWTVDVCAEIPSGYKVTGVYNENGDLVSTSQCAQTLVKGQVKVIAFEVTDIGSPEPSFGTTLNLKGPKGNKQSLKLAIKDLRKSTFDAKVKEAKEKKGKGQGPTGALVAGKDDLVIAGVVLVLALQLLALYILRNDIQRVGRKVNKR